LKKSRRAKTPATENPKSEYRNPKQTQRTREIQNTNPKHPVWNLLIFEHLDLFRISDFELGLFP